jgi:hypothetical protein
LRFFFIYLQHCFEIKEKRKRANSIEEMPDALMYPEKRTDGHEQHTGLTEK